MYKTINFIEFTQNNQIEIYKILKKRTTENCIHYVTPLGF